MKKVLTRNIPLKILSFLLAIVLWVVIMNIDDPYITKTFDNIPVIEKNADIFSNISTLYEVESGSTVSVKVRGRRLVLDDMKASDFEATADFKEMSRVNAVPIRVAVKEPNKYRNADIEFIDQNDMMTLSLEEADSQTFRVNVKTIGEAKEGYYVTDLVANPNIIEISGSKKQVAKIKEVIVEVSVDQMSDTFDTITSPKVLDENGYPVDDAKLQFQTKDIAVQTTVLPTKEIGIIVSKEGNPFFGYSFIKMEHEPKVVTIAGTQEDLDDIGYITIPFNLDQSKETLRDTKYLENYLDTSKYTIVGDGNSVAITAIIEELESKDITILPSQITMENMSPDYEAEIHTPGNIILHVMGPIEKLNGITVDSLNPTVDLGDYDTGTYSITINCTLEGGVTIRPATISIEIREKPDE